MDCIRTVVLHSFNQELIKKSVSNEQEQKSSLSRTFLKLVCDEAIYQQTIIAQLTICAWKKRLKGLQLKFFLTALIKYFLDDINFSCIFVSHLYHIHF